MILDHNYTNGFDGLKINRIVFEKFESMHNESIEAPVSKQIENNELDINYVDKERDIANLEIDKILEELDSAVKNQLKSKKAKIDQFLTSHTVYDPKNISGNRKNWNKDFGKALNISGESLKNTITNIQAMSGLKIDGMIGPNTAKAIADIVGSKVDITIIEPPKKEDLTFNVEVAKPNENKLTPEQLKERIMAVFNSGYNKAFPGKPLLAEKNMANIAKKYVKQVSVSGKELNNPKWWLEAFALEGFGQKEMINNLKIDPLRYGWTQDDLIARDIGDKKLNELHVKRLNQFSKFFGEANPENFRDICRKLPYGVDTSKKETWNKALYAEAFKLPYGKTLSPEEIDKLNLEDSAKLASL